ncbi:MAG: hypothetical protein KJ061_15095 [Vicinamibacteraceae bacterium]|nr:hypothetical protein [Vicinamibacteraceae bacterium]
MLLWALAFAIVMGAGCSTPIAGQSDRAAMPSLEGTWGVSLTYYYDGTVTGPSDNLQFLQQFHQDGRAVIYLPQFAGQRFDETRTACAGEWKRSGGQTFDVTLYCLWTEMWVDEPSVPDRILIKVTMDPGGRTWTATPFRYQPFVDGEYLGWPGWGDMRGVRLGIVPIQ